MHRIFPLNGSLCLDPFEVDFPFAIESGQKLFDPRPLGLEFLLQRCSDSRPLMLEAHPHGVHPRVGIEERPHEPIHGLSHGRDPITMKVADLLHELRTSDCSTSFFRSPVGGVKDCYRGIDNGYLEGGVAISLKDKTYTGARIAVMTNNMPLDQNPVEDFRLCVLDLETRQLRATSYNLADELNAAPRFAAIPESGYDFPAEPEDIFTEPLTLREGEPVILAAALFGQYASRNVSIVNEVCNKPMMRRFPQLGFNSKSTVTPAVGPFGYPSGDYEGGIPGPIGTDASGNYPSIDLLPFP